MRNKKLLKFAHGEFISHAGNIVGIDFLHSERSYDIILQVTLEKSELDNYQNDPYHCSVVKKHMHSVRESSVAVDYEI